MPVSLVWAACSSRLPAVVCRFCEQHMLCRGVPPALRHRKCSAIGGQLAGGGTIPADSCLKVLFACMF